jgi:hypothetical protein
MYTEIVGRLEGKLDRIISVSHPGVEYYYSVLKKQNGEFDSRNESCIIVFSKIDDYVKVNLFGDDVNTEGHRYSGLYISNTALSINENEKLLSIFYDYYDTNKIKELLGLNIRYFLEIFDSIKIETYDEIVIIEGWEPGGNRWTNGIIKIEGENVYIMFGDTRQDPRYLYFTNDNKKHLPNEFIKWRLFPELNKIRKIIS